MNRREKYDIERRKKKETERFYIDKLIDQIHEHHDVDARSKNRKDYHVTLRVALTLFIRQIYPDFTYQEIGDILGGRDHSTIIHYVQNQDAFKNADRVGIFFQNWMAKILAIHPKINITNQINCRALIGHIPT